MVEQEAEELVELLTSGEEISSSSEIIWAHVLTFNLLFLDCEGIMPLPSLCCLGGIRSSSLQKLEVWKGIWISFAFTSIYLGHTYILYNV
jgi:hypothetical protein